MTHRNRAIVVGAGIFGVAAARELRARGFAVVLLDPGPVPHPLAASTDVSKLVRGDYGADALYTGLMEAALPLWARWNATLPRPLVHFSGWSVLSTTPMAPGSFEADSFTALEARGAAPERLDAARIAHALPAWAGGGFVDGYLNPRVGWAESAEVVAQLVSEALAEGVELRVGARVTAVEEALGRVTGVRLEGDERLAAELVVVAAGAWTQKLVPALADRFETVGQPVFHLRPEDPDAFRPPRFLAWAADIGRTGWYGFPATADGVVKLANHGEGVPLDPDAPREVTAPMLLAARRFLRDRLPALAEAPIVATRLCLYCDTFDGDFLIDRSPDVAGLVVATGGSGHGFKFAPVLGRLVGEALDGAAHPRFAWRARQAAAKESARARGRGLGVRWEETWAGLGLTPPRAALAALLDAWSQPARAYHGLQHLDTCLRAAEAVSDLASRPAEVALALWLHDAVYDPRARPGDNEAKSALWAAELLREAGAEAEVVARVSAMIEATAHHDREDPGDDEGGDGALLLDIDLAVLGAGPAAYAAYEAGVRAEYAFAPDAAWRVGRRAVLEGILGRPWIYRTAVFRELFETRARENLSAALASLA